MRGLATQGFGHAAICGEGGGRVRCCRPEFLTALDHWMILPLFYLSAAGEIPSKDASGFFL
jgi:hypothetical protein